MATKEYIKLEKHIKAIFEQSPSFTFDGIRYEIEKVGKPTCMGGGEPKTDCYVLGRNGNQAKELKISIKLEAENEFQGNKLSPKTAEAYFGVDWATIIEKATRSAKDVIENQPLLFRKKKGRTQADSITLGWKLEITDKYRPLSSPIPLTDNEIRDFIYKGTKLPIHQKNALVNGIEIQNSGIADYIIYTKRNKIATIDDVISQLQEIEHMPLQPTYLVFTANNYRTRVDKWDGRRYLCVLVQWSVENGVLVPHYEYSHPLEANTETVLPNLKQALQQLPSMHPTEMSDGIVAKQLLLT